MPSSSILVAVDVAAILIGIGLVMFGAYKAFVSRRVLTDSSFRNLATWTGILLLLGIPYEVNLMRQELGLGFSGPVNTAYVIIVALAGAFVVFALLDRAIRLGLGLDFFHRDIFLWQRGGRIVAWTIATVALSSYWLLNFQYGAFVASVTLAYAFSVLALSITRAHESAILDYIKWWGVTLVGIVAAATFATFTGSNFFQIFVAYFFFRTAASLSGSTYHANFVWHFDAPRDFVYSVYTNPSMLTKINSFYRSATVRAREPDGSDIVDLTAEALGIKMAVTLKRRYVPPGDIEEEFTSDLGNGSTRFSFAKENGGTRVRVFTDFQPRGVLTKFFGGFGLRRVKRQFEQDYAVGRRYCEENKPR